MFVIGGLLHGGTSIVTAHLKMHDKLEIFVENQNVIMQPKYYKILENYYLLEGKILGNKMLSNQLWWPEKRKIGVIEENFRFNKYIFIFRDPRDFMESGKEDRDHSFEDSIKTWNTYTRNVFNFVDRNKEKCIWFQFEDFVLMPGVYCTRICDLLGIEYQKKMLNFYMYEEQFRKKYGNKIDLSRINVWKRHEDQDFIKAISKRFDPVAMKRIGYKI